MSVFGSPHDTARGVAHLRGMTRLQELNFHGRLATDAVLREIAGIPGLRHLHCQDIASGDEGFIALGAYAAFGTQITDESLGLLAGMPQLERVELENCAGITDEGLRVLAAAPRLRKLSAWSCMRVTGAWTSICVVWCG
jgi:hypothetical protein